MDKYKFHENEPIACFVTNFTPHLQQAPQSFGASGEPARKRHSHRTGGGFALFLIGSVSHHRSACVCVCVSTLFVVLFVGLLMRKHSHYIVASCARARASYRPWHNCAIFDTVSMMCVCVCVPMAVRPVRTALHTTARKWRGG